jgi:hypothetical protein
VPWVLAALGLVAAVVVPGPWLLLIGFAVAWGRGTSWAAAGGWLALLLALDVLAYGVERRAPRAPPWRMTVAAAAAVAALAAGVGSWLGTALAALGIGFGEVRAFTDAWRRLIRLVEVRLGKLALGLMALLLPWPH